MALSARRAQTNPPRPRASELPPSFDEWYSKMTQEERGYQDLLLLGKRADDAGWLDWQLDQKDFLQLRDDLVEANEHLCGDNQRAEEG